MKRLAILASVVVGLASEAPAAAPPALVNYQGVLRSASDAPLSGSYDMVFRFFSANVAGDEILVDIHTAALGGAVAVGGGLFSVQLGSGFLNDGAGPGTYTSVADVFRDYGTVYLSVQVGAETLTPRTRILSSAYAANATNLDGRGASSFLDTSSTTQTKLGTATFNSSAVSGRPGIEASGVYPSSGGHFLAPGYSGEAFLAGGDSGIAGFGTYAGGIFRSGTPTSYTDEAYLASGDIGVQGYGDVAGGFFQRRSSTTRAGIATGNGLGIGLRIGVEGYGDDVGAYFKGPQNTIAKLGGLEPYSNFYYCGVYGQGEIGGYFNAGNTGVVGQGTVRGGEFADADSSLIADVAIDSYKILGNGSMAFVQNHPTRKDRVIVYNAPEGDEVATYTRGTAFLADGVAHVSLGETFPWVTNPDVGLTAFVTPLEQWTDLYVESKTTRDLVVRSRDPKAKDASFDYIVYGLRIGFEETSIVQEKTREARIPSMASHRKRYEEHPELKGYDALRRFEHMKRGTSVDSTASGTRAMTAAKALHDAIEEYDPNIHGSSGQGLLPGGAASISSNVVSAVQQTTEKEPATNEPSAEPRAKEPPTSLAGGNAPLNLVAVSTDVEVGDVLVLDPDDPDSLAPGSIAADPAVVGIVVATSPASVDGGHAYLALAGTIVLCKVDAGHGAIRARDLLTVSPTRGHAMRSTDQPPGTVLGKALEPLPAGTGLIRVLVMSR